MNFRVLNKSQSLLTVLFIIIVSLTVPAADHPQAQSGKHFLWSIQTDDNTVYLLGSIHVMKQSAYPLPGQFQSAYTRSKKVVFETDLDGMSNPELQSSMMRLSLYPAGESLSQSISPLTYRLLEERLARSGLPVENFEKFKPWFIALTVTAMEIQRLGFDPELGIDSHFFSKAKQDGKEMLFLESNEFQIGLMAELSGQQQELFLKQTLQELRIIESMASDMIAAWESGDTGRLHAIINEGFREYPEVYDRFFTQRNRHWASQIEKLLKQKDDVLVIAGAGHFVGENSLIELLKKKGYRITQR